MLRTTGVNKNAYARAGWWIAIASSLMLVIPGCTASPGDTSADPVGFAPIHVQGTGSVIMGDSVVNGDGSVLASGYFGAGTVTLANVEDAPSITSEMPNNIFFLKLDKNGDFDWSATLS